MEKPVSLKPEHIRDEKVKVLLLASLYFINWQETACKYFLDVIRVMYHLLLLTSCKYIRFCLFTPQCQVLQSVEPIQHEEVVIGQYDGYKDDPTVPDESNTPTYASVVLRVHNERWEGKYYLMSYSKKNSQYQEVLQTSLTRPHCWDLAVPVLYTYADMPLWWDMLLNAGMFILYWHTNIYIIQEFHSFSRLVKH